MNSTNINYLNNDCLLEVYQYLPMLTRMTCALVCKKWASFPIKSIEITDEFVEEYIQTFQNTTPESFIIFLRNVMKNCGSSLNIIKLKGSFENLNMSQIILDFSKYCKNIKYLSIDGGKNRWNVSNLKLLFKNNPNIYYLSLKDLCIDDGECFLELKPNTIQELEILDTDIDSGSHSLTYLLENQKHIKKISLDVYDFFMETTEIADALNLSNCQNIIEFLISGNKSNFSHASDANLFLKQRNLKKIRLNDFIADEQFLNKLPIDNVEFIGLDFDEHLPYYSLSRFKNLRELQCEVEELTDLIIKGITECSSLMKLDIIIHEDYSLTEYGERYFQRLENIEAIKINTPFYFNVDNIMINLNKSKNLKDVDLLSCLVTDIGLNGLSLLPNLTNLSISFCSGSDEDFINLVQKAIHLKQLNLRGSSRVTNQFIQKASEIKMTRKDTHNLVIFPNEEINVRELIDLSSLIIIKND